jgi:pimeloyl-ACP methyl ester carboxylesterase
MTARTTYTGAPTDTVHVSGTRFAYRRLGVPSIRRPVLIANGDQDLMAPSSNSADLARRLPNARLKLYPDAGHGGIFQHHDEFVAEVLQFLSSSGKPRPRRSPRGSARPAAS